MRRRYSNLNSIPTDGCGSLKSSSLFMRCTLAVFSCCVLYPLCDICFKSSICLPALSMISLRLLSSSSPSLFYHNDFKEKSFDFFFYLQEWQQKRGERRRKCWIKHLLSSSLHLFRIMHAFGRALFEDLGDPLELLRPTESIPLGQNQILPFLCLQWAKKKNA